MVGVVLRLSDITLRIWFDTVADWIIWLQV
jgi:hypothetical protein